ncbi:methylated-DNA--[protein]-cysteine S-methyltransferase [Blastochloris viridis]|uniref:methylated-DNA--[protein]-cysteine S-methyltransferase n=1 Tax=Blastochloris viridis TaxID=1079 RepID=A0A0H5BPA7_BLAVI|nr:methylated-DNA--[protein]-cysteine S-methyltransferase [Blastochloris viridis]ALK11009.1 Bifunctional transcriptional activator/DNA repair enzyme Ada [Blastochloris viridis]BAR99003.1 aDA regulatory protein [Blastochloris viridis]CUU43671.1 Regulatory protein of adaptative response [Blastochloris viridis]
MLDRATLTPDAGPNLGSSLDAQADWCADYEVVRRAIAFITEAWRSQPEAEAIATAAGVDIRTLNALFRRWAGLTPKGFLQAVTLDHAKRVLAGSGNVLDAAFELGLSGPGRLHDLFVTHEAMSPGEWQRGGAGAVVRFGFHPSPFGTALVMATARGLAGLAFADPGGEAAALADMRARWPAAQFEDCRDATAPLVRRIFDPTAWQPEVPLRVVLIGSDFEIRVWETLLKIPFGRAASYAALAHDIGRPTAARAVGAAVGRNPIAFVVPCHRVVGSGGALTGYHWGLTRKRAMLGWEAGWRAAAA